MKAILQALHPTINFLHSDRKISIKFITFLILLKLSYGQINETLFQSPTSPAGLDTLFIVDAGDLGKIKGVPLITENLNNYIGFFGIYYASFESYLGEKRFQPSEIWKGPLQPQVSIPGLFPPVYQANNQFIFCPQPNLFRHSLVENYKKILTIQKPLDPNFHQEYQKAFGPNNLVTGEEKCLTLNIFIQKVPAPHDKLLPVVFFFHGGGSEILSPLLAGNLFGAGRFLDHNIILVLINYRLGGLGSLNLNIDQIPGNAGLYDTITALKWVKEYIHFFGGDADKITIAGQSAGAMMATHLMLTPLAQGLFSGVIALSGCALSPWAMTKNPLPLHLKIAEYSECYNPNSNKTSEDDEEDSEKVMRDIRQCLIQLPYEKIVIATHKQSIEHENKGYGLVYESRVPSIQADSLTIERIIAKHPLETLKAGEQNNVSIIIGATRHDGSFGVSNFYNRYLQFNNLLDNKHFMKHQILRKFLEMLGHFASPMFYHSVGSYFMGTARDTEGLIDIATVFAFKDGELQLIEEHSKMNPNCYSYSFEYRGDISLQEMVNGRKPIPGGIGHADDIHYLFNMLPLTSDDDKKLSRKLLTYLVDFAHFGNPNGKVPKKKEKWPRFKTEDSPYLIINKEDSVGFFQRDHWANISIELFKKIY